jgi:hypothetical protein
MRSVRAMMSFYNAREVRTNTNRPVMTVSPCDFFPPGKVFLGPSFLGMKAL